MGETDTLRRLLQTMLQHSSLWDHWRRDRREAVDYYVCRHCNVTALVDVGTNVETTLESWNEVHLMWCVWRLATEAVEYPAAVRAGGG